MSDEPKRDRHHLDPDRVLAWRGNSKVRPERVDIRCTIQQRGRFYSAVKLARQLRKATNPAAELMMCEAVNDVIIPAFEKLIRGFLCGSAAERSLASVYLEDFIRKDDYLSVRRSFNPAQMMLEFQEAK